ncbi:GGDEF domain-containing protein [Pseudorhodoferax sp.]|uniref:GGDEF domain-containing protein n=1 Tax=Pseudorhodoferax sp. TaxID=1993553 RepID=UPI002DD61902|nr:GGDEF domain-containing protein [Pseudorhodoferax sp.]
MPSETPYTPSPERLPPSAVPAADGIVIRQILTALGESPMLVALFDPDDRIHWCSAAFRCAFGLAADEWPTWADLMRRSHRQGHGSRIQTADFEHWLASARSRRGKLRQRAFESDLSDGRWFWTTEVVNGEGWMLTVAADISGLRQDLRRLRQDRDVARRAALTDTLTGISNRAHALEVLEQALLEQAQPGGARCQPLCVAVLDLDHFKRVNDTLGHAAGDAVICDFARLLQAGIRRADTCARLGGEEFLLVLPDSRLDEAGLLLQRLRAQVHRSRPIPGHPDWRYTFSGGVAQARPAETVKDLLARADQLLYCAKQAGRDRMAPQNADG